MRMQMTGRIALHNSQSHSGRLFVIQYDDFNPFLDHFADRLSARKQRDPARVLAEWKLWDHMDAILSLGVTSLVDRMLQVPQPGGPAANQINESRLKSLDRQQKRDLLLLAACYDDSLAESALARWKRLRRKLGFFTWLNGWDLWLGLAVTVAVVGDDSLPARVELAHHDLAVPDRRRRLAAVARAVLEVALRRPADRPQRPRAQAGDAACCGGS